MNGSTYKRCSCPKSRRCRKNHGSWYFCHDLPAARGSKRRPRITQGGFASKEDAQAALNDSLTRFRQRGMAAERDLAGRRQFLADYLDQWIAGRQRLKPTTRQSYGMYIECYLNPYLGHFRLEELGVSDIEAMYEQLRRPGASHAGKDRLSPATIQRIHATLRKALNDAVRRRILDMNPARLVELERAPLPRPKYWNSTEAGRFLDAIVDDRLYALYQLTIHRGLRRGEVVALRWRDVDLRRWTIDINRSVVQVGYDTVEGSPKSAASNRMLSLDRETVLTLEAHRGRQREEFRTLGREVTPEDYVFTRADGERYHPDHLSKSLQRLIKRADVPLLTFHQLRHTAAALMLEAGADIKYVQHVLGHEDMFITARIYAHITARLDRERSAQVANLIPRSRPAKPSKAGDGGEPNDRFDIPA